MFEFSLVKKYLTPKKKQLSVSLIALMSVSVISIVVWLVLVFLSITEGIERSWVEKLTALNGPIRIQPTEKYFSSYFYQVDQYANGAGYHLKNIKQKATSPLSNPYNPESDEELPFSFPKPDLESDGTLKDPVKKAYKVLGQFKEKVPGFAFQDYEVSGALLRLQLTPNPFSHQFLTQVSYLVSFTDQNPHIHSILANPAVKDLNHLILLAGKKWDHVCEDVPKVEENASLANLLPILKNITIEEMQTTLHLWKLPTSLLPENGSFNAAASSQQGQITHLILQKDPATKGQLKIKQNELFFNGEKLARSTPIFVEGPLQFQASLLESSLKGAKSVSDIRFKVKTVLQKQRLEGEMNWEGLEISKAQVQNHFKASPQELPPWPHFIEKAIVLPKSKESAMPIFLSRNFQENGVKLGDRGYLSYPSMTASGLQEQRFAVAVAGFYDGGIMAMSSKYILVPPQVTEVINASNSPYSVDRMTANGIALWLDQSLQSEKMKEELEGAFKAEGIDTYWKITTYKDYDFAKDLLQQFQSDKYLFTLIGVIVLAVACSNIISMLILLVQNKKREIGILQAMGASKNSIALIFGLCGISIGILSSLIGITLALLTLHNIDFVVKILSLLQGHEAFNALFFGQSLPDALSSRALYFVLIATPLISLLAGLIPAIKACRLQPSQILRAE
ncbi:MAG TPA: FtsX-like permease family protein [Rhabdochlamydiaceae bacterium]|nr:FtsX-like permease family protein [Rhabdochlamydiaceae bacterium]